MNKKLILLIFAFFIVILIVFLYRRNKSDVAKTLAKFNVEAMTFDNTAGIEEGRKMTSPEMLKNTIMSLKPLKDEIILSNVPDSEVELFTNCDFQGPSAKFKTGDYKLQDLINKGIENDEVSSIKVPEGYTAILYHHDNFSGFSLSVSSDIACLKNFYNDEFSSIKVVKGKIKKTIREGLFFIKVLDKFVTGEIGKIGIIESIDGFSLKPITIEDTRTLFATSNSAITGYASNNPIPFLLSFVSSTDNNQTYEFDLYDVTGKVYGLDQYKKLGRLNVEIKDGNIYMKQHGKYFKYNNSSIQTTDNINEASECELVSVLDPDMANKYLQASYNYLNTSGVNRDSLNTFCGSNIRFSDGTLKLYPNSIAKNDKGLPIDPIERVFESICACHMNKDFYKNALCSDEMIKLNFGIDPENPKNKSLLDSIRDDMKCMKPNCTFEKCRNVITNEKNYIKINQQSTSDNITEGCGSGVICITNQNINIGEGAVLQDTTINAESISQCGGERISKPQMLDVGDFIWLDDSKTILGKEQKCFITQDGVSRIVDSKTTGCSDITMKSYIEFNNPEKIRETIDSTTGLKTISLKGITINESSLDVNTVKEFIHEKLKDMLNLPGITDIQVSYNKPALVITYFDEIPEKSNNKPTPELTPSKKSNNNMIYIIILILLILGTGGYFIMKKK